MKVYKRYSQVYRDQVLLLFDEGTSVIDICQNRDLHISTVYNWLKIRKANNGGGGYSTVKLPSLAEGTETLVKLIEEAAKVPALRNEIHKLLKKYSLLKEQYETCMTRIRKQEAMEMRVAAAHTRVTHGD